MVDEAFLELLLLGVQLLDHIVCSKSAHLLVGSKRHCYLGMKYYSW